MLGRFGKTWEYLGRLGKIWKDLGRPGKVWEYLERLGKIWKDLGRFGKTWEDLGRFGKTWEELAQSIFFGKVVLRLALRLYQSVAVCISNLFNKKLCYMYLGKHF